MRFFQQLSTDRITSLGACSYGLFWVLALGAAILDRKNFHPNTMFFFGAGCAVLYFIAGMLALWRIRGSTRLLQAATVIGAALILAAFTVAFVSEHSLLGRGLLVSFGQLQIVYAVCLCQLLGHKD